MALDDLHIVGVANNKIWHTIFLADGSCQGYFGDVNSQQTNPGDLGQISDVDCAADGANILHVTAATNTGLWHTYRQALSQGSGWQGMYGYVNGQMNNPTAPGLLQQVHAAAGAGILQLIVDGANHGPWHTIRYQNGGWSGSFGDIHSQVPDFQYSSTTVGASDDQGNLYVVGNYNTSGNYGSLVLSVRDYSSGSWSIEPVWQPGRVDPAWISSLSVAYHGSQGGYQNLCVGQVNTNRMGLSAYYDADQKTWQGWNLLTQGPITPPQNMMDISCAYLSNGNLVFVVVADSPNPAIGKALYMLRLVNGQWQPWVSINDQMNNGAQVGSFSRVGISAVPTN